MAWRPGGLRGGWLREIRGCGPGDQELAMSAMVPLLCELLTGRLWFDDWRFFCVSCLLNNQQHLREQIRTT